MDTGIFGITGTSTSSWNMPKPTSEFVGMLFVGDGHRAASNIVEGEIGKDSNGTI